jgi:hypothetical protein
VRSLSLDLDSDLLSSSGAVSEGDLHSVLCGSHLPVSDTRRSDGHSHARRIVQSLLSEDDGGSTDQRRAHGVHQLELSSGGVEVEGFGFSSNHLRIAARQLSGSIKVLRTVVGPNEVGAVASLAGAECSSLRV